MGGKTYKKPPSDEGGGICEANDGGRDWVEGASPRPTWCVISWRLTTSAGAEVGAPSRRAPRKKASPFQGEAVERSETDEGAHGGDAPLIAPSSGPAGHLPPCGGKACGRPHGPPLQKSRSVATRRGRRGRRPKAFPFWGRWHRLPAVTDEVVTGICALQITKEEFLCPPTTPRITI